MNNEKTITVVINAISDIYNLVSVCCRSIECNNIYAHRGKIVVPCSSILGIFAIDPSQPVNISYPVNEYTVEFDNFISHFEVKE